MNPSAEHIIRSAKLILALDEQKNSIEHQNAISALFSGMLIPAMNAIFDRLSSDERVIKIDKIEIDIGVVEFKGDPESLGYFQNDFNEMIKDPEKIRSQFESVIEGIIEKYLRVGEAEVTSTEDSNEEILLYFLEYGRLPWNSRYKAVKELFSAISDLTLSDKFGEKLRPLLEKTNVKSRLFGLKDSGIQAKIITALLFHFTPDDWFGLSDNFEENINQLISKNKEEQADSPDAAAEDVELKNIEELLSAFQGEMDGLIKELNETMTGLESELQQFSNENPKEETAKDFSQGYCDEAILLYFIQYGRLPQNGRYTATAELYKNLSETTFSFGFGMKLMDLVRQENVRKRLIGLTDTRIQLKIAKVLLGQLPKEDDVLRHEELQNFEKNDEATRIEALDKIFKKCFNEQEEKLGVDMAGNLSSGYDDNADYIHIKYAGIVLAHPFLLPMFKDVALIENKSFIGVEQQWRAIYMLHYLATGDTDLQEEDSTLYKLLCGLQPEDAMPQGIILTNKERDACADVWNSVIEHWTALRSTSHEALRENFFQREGLLNYTDSGLYLKVQQEAIDILFNYSGPPWSMSMAMLPWLNKLITIDWAS